MSRQPANPSPSGAALSARLRAHTRDCHQRAERSGIIRQITGRTVSRPGYVRYLRHLQAVYATMEQKLAAWQTDPVLAPFSDPALARAPALAHDLDCLVGAGWREVLPLQQAGADYCRRIEAAATPELLAHAYVRYLGDLNGGRVMPRLLTEALALPPDCLAFYRFTALAEPARCLADLRAAIDHGVAAEEWGRVLDEARLAFELNIRLAESVVADAA